MRLVVNGERLSGHSNTNKYPELYVRNGKGPGGGALICTIETFHWVRVQVRGETTTMWFEDQTCLEVTGGVVEYYDPTEG